MREGIGYGFVFRWHRDQVFATVRPKTGCAHNRQVVRLGGTRGPDEAARIGAKQVRQPLPRIFKNPA